MLSESINAEGFAQKYVYFTLSYEENAPIQRGVRVYRILPDGTDEKKIGQDKEYALLSVTGEHLIYSYNSQVYSTLLTSQTETLET